MQIVSQLKNLFGWYLACVRRPGLSNFDAGTRSLQNNKKKKKIDYSNSRIYTARLIIGIAIDLLIVLIIKLDDELEIGVYYIMSNSFFL
jgi:hypothetical protein